MFRLGGWEFLAILLIVMIIWGPKNIPKLAAMFGRMIRDYKNASKDDSRRDEDPARSAMNSPSHEPPDNRPR